jgi:Ni/Co efflux regulator RcnB
MRRLIAVFLLTGSLAGPALAADHPGKGQPARHSGAATISIEIGGDQRNIVRDYYGAQIAQGRCPPGLAKKNNGCQPPGQAKKWSRGRPLPHDVVYHALQRDLAIRLNAPMGAKYVRVAADILLIAAGTGVVLDAIEDLGRI